MSLIIIGPVLSSNTPAPDPITCITLDQIYFLVVVLSELTSLPLAEKNLPAGGTNLINAPGDTYLKLLELNAPTGTDPFILLK